MGKLSPEAGEKRPTEYFVDVINNQVIVGRAALTLYFEAGGHPADIYDLAEALDDKSIPLDTLSDPTVGVTREEILEQARFITRIMGDESSANSLRLHIARRARVLDLLASEHYIIKPDVFGSLRNLQAALGLEGIDKRRRFDHFDIDDILDHLDNVSTQEGKKPTQEILWRRIRNEKKDEITPRAIYRRIPLSSALELLGFIDIRKWEDHHYVQWGVDYVLSNNVRLPNRVSADALSMKELGPSAANICVRFGKMNKYKNEVTNRLLSICDEIKTATGDHEVPPGLFFDTYSARDIIRRYLIYKLVSDLLPEQSMPARTDIASEKHNYDTFVESVRAFRPSLTPEEIEKKARNAGIYYYIFPKVNVPDALKTHGKRESDRDLPNNEALLKTELAKLEKLVHEFAADKSGLLPGIGKRIAELEAILQNPPSKEELRNFKWKDLA